MATYFKEKVLGPESWAYQQGADIANRGLWPELPTPDLNRPVNKEQAAVMAENIANLSPMGPMVGMVRGLNAMSSKGLSNQALAEMMHEAGAKNRAITEATGWHLGPDKKWREEFSDAPSRVNYPELFGAHPGSAKTANMLENVLKHPELYEYYPSLREMRVFYDPYQVGSHYQGGRFPEIVIGGGTRTGEKTMAPHSRNERELHSSLLHEIQHAIQEKEGFLRGGGPEQMPKVVYEAGRKVQEQISTLKKLESKLAPNSKAASTLRKKIAKLDRDLETMLDSPNFTAYKALYGEAEARAVQRRMYQFSEEARRKPGDQFLDIVKQEKPEGFPDYLYRTQDEKLYVPKPFENWEEIKQTVRDIQKSESDAFNAKLYKGSTETFGPIRRKRGKPMVKDKK
jgi:hypothetical protein